MTFTIGRSELTYGPEQARWNGDQVSFSLQVSEPGDVVGAHHAAANLRAMTDDRDDPVIPVTWDADPRWDGYYDVLSTSVDEGPRAWTTGVHRATVTLQRVANGWQTARREWLIDARSIGDDFGLQNSDRWRWCFAVPQGFSWDVDLTARTVTTAEGSVPLEGIHGSAEVFGLSSGDDTSERADGHAYLPAASNYSTSATLEIQGGDGVWRPVHGRQVERGSAWRIHNGLVCFEADVTPFSATVGRLAHPWADAWHFDADVAVGSISGGTWITRVARWDQGATPIVLRNSPDLVAVRVHGRDGAHTLTARIGSPFIEIDFWPDNPALAYGGLALLEAGSAQNLTIGNQGTCGVMQTAVAALRQAQAVIASNSDPIDIDTSECAWYAPAGTPLTLGYKRTDLSVASLLLAQMSRTVMAGGVVTR